MKKIDQINEKLNKGREKLKQIEEKYNNDSKKIAELIQKRANLLADEAIEPDPQKKVEIKKVNEELENLRKSIEGGPELINAVGEKLKNIELEKSNEELRLSFEKQKKLGSKIVDLSGKLIESLGQSNAINEQLQGAWNEYINLSKMTGKGAIKEGSKTIRGSFGSLKFLCGILNYEYREGKPRGRTDLPLGTQI